MQKKDCNHLGITFNSTMKIHRVNWRFFLLIDNIGEVVMFEKLFKKKEAMDNNLYAPIEGEYIELEKIPDKVFASGMIGTGCGIVPKGEKVTAPVNGEIIMVADTKHAIGIKSEMGAEILLHIGLETVAMNGEGFEVLVKVGDKIKVGQDLLRFDLKKIEEKADSEISAFLISNSDEFEKININVEKNYEKKEKIGECITK